MSAKTEGTPRTDFVAHKSGDAEWNRSINRFGRMLAHAQILEREAADLRERLAESQQMHQKVAWCLNEGDKERVRMRAEHESSLASERRRVDALREFAERLLCVHENRAPDKASRIVDGVLRALSEPQQSAQESAPDSVVVPVGSIPLNASCRAYLVPSDGWNCDCRFKHPILCSEAAASAKEPQ